MSVPVAHRAEVLILQHPLEAGHAKGTARLLHLCLPRSRMEVGEAFEPAALHGWLTAPWPDAAAPAGTGPHAVLLYPPSAPDPALPLAAPPALPAHWLAGDAAALRLVVLDGTWRKSRKMLYANPLLQALPRLPLPPDLPAARYGRIRRAHAPHQLSTLEASCAALAFVEGDAARYAPVLNALEAFMDRQAERPALPAASPAGC
ncbi:tRNA-uridine aminocarboxypropyltransferase [Paracidovorax wautersii]|uniref:tRNA-uridine aminocarboxypropyltransferase n=1 Tax=Paracidovorax wautersii TaxID=1177982 RepID=UPI0031D602BF